MAIDVSTFNKDEKSQIELVEATLGIAQEFGCSQAEAAIGQEDGLSASIRMGEVDTLEHHRDKGLGITVYFGKRKGSANTSDFSLDSVRATVDAACRIARHTGEDEFSGLPDKNIQAWDYPDLKLCYPWQLDSEQAIELALEAEQFGRDFDKRISNSDGASVNSHTGFHVYGNTNGFIGAYPTSRHSISCTLIGQDSIGMQRDYWYSVARDSTQLESVKKIGEEAARRTLAKLDARKLKTCDAPVIYSPEMAAGLIGHFVGAIRGGSQYRQTSFLLDRCDTQIFPDWMNICERPHLTGGLGSAPYDSEGVVTRDSDLVRDGVLQHYVLDSYSARRLKLETTGNAGGVHNLLVKCGKDSTEDLFRQMGTGLYVTELMGQGINSVTGDYSRGAAGFWIENGEIQYPVEEITVAGNLKDIFMQIQAVSSDVDLRRNIQTGAVLIENMTIAGN